MAWPLHWQNAYLLRGINVAQRKRDAGREQPRKDDRPALASSRPWHGSCRAVVARDLSVLSVTCGTGLVWYGGSTKQRPVTSGHIGFRGMTVREAASLAVRAHRSHRARLRAPQLFPSVPFPSCPPWSFSGFKPLKRKKIGPVGPISPSRVSGYRKAGPVSCWMSSPMWPLVLSDPSVICDRHDFCSRSHRWHELCSYAHTRSIRITPPLSETRPAAPRLVWRPCSKCGTRAPHIDRAPSRNIQPVVL